MRDARKVHRKTIVWYAVDVGRSDGGHESNSLCQTITEVLSVCRIKAVFMMGIARKPKTTNTILKGFAGTPRGDQVVVTSNFLVAIS